MKNRPEVSKTDIEIFEKYVDGYGMLRVINTLSYIASEKSIHVGENWQDVALAQRWMGYSVCLDGCHRRLEDIDADL